MNNKMSLQYLLATYNLLFKVKYLCIIFLSFSFLSVSAATNYIDPTCLNNGDGTGQSCATGSGLPGAKNTWSGLTWAAGNSYLQKRGTIYIGQVAPGTDGTSGNPIVIGDYDSGAKPIIRSSSTDALYINNRLYVTVQNLRFEGINNNAAFIQSNFYNLHDVTVQNSEFYVSGTASKYAVYLFVSPSYHIYNFNFIGNDVQNASTNSNSDGLRVYVPGAKTIYDSTFSNNTFHDITASGLRFFAADTPNLILNDNRPYGIIIEGNTFTNNGMDAIQMQAGLKSPTGHQSYIRNNTAQTIGSSTRPNVNAFQLHWVDSVKIYGNTINNVITSVPDGSGIILDWIDVGSATTTYSNNNEIYNNQISGCLAGGASGAIDVWDGKNNKIHHNILTGNSVGIGVAQQYSTGNEFYNNVMHNNATNAGRLQDPANIGSPASVWRNNIFSGSGNYGFSVVNNSIIPTESHNLFWNNMLSDFRNEASSTNIALSIYSSSSDPYFINPGSNFRLLTPSFGIDMGTTTSFLSDYVSSPIYGTPDIGAYEYQPPYTVGVDKVDISAGARIYADGKFRNLGVSSSNYADLKVTPTSSSFPVYAGTTTRPEWLNITNMTWNKTGTYSKQWTESSNTLGTSSVLHVVGDLRPSTTYALKIDGVVDSMPISDALGKITYTYSGGYSSHVFTLNEAQIGGGSTGWTTSGNSNSGGSSLLVQASTTTINNQIQQATTTIMSTSTNQLSPVLGEVLAQPIVTNSCSYTFKKNMAYGSRSEDVKKLQQFLNSDVRTRVALKGISSPGNETTYFNFSTYKAVIKYQKLHLKELNLTYATGNVYGGTRRLLNGCVR